MAPKVGSVQSDPTHCWRVATLTPLPRAPLFLTPKSDPRDPVAISFREPYVAVGTGGDPSRVRVGGDAPAVLGDHPGRRDLPDPVAATFREPLTELHKCRKLLNGRQRPYGDCSRLSSPSCAAPTR